MSSSHKDPPQEHELSAQIAALADAISLAPLGVLSSHAVIQLTIIRDRLIALSLTQY